MTDTIVYVSDQVIDLSPGTVIAQSIKRLNIGDLSTRSVNHTNLFKGPFTENNNRIYQYANDVRSKTTVPYSIQPTRVVQSGIELIRDGVHYMKRAKDQYEVYILSNAAAFFDAIGDKKLNELNFVGINGSWNNNDIENYRATTSGIVAPVMDYGNYNPVTNAIGVSDYLPSIYYHTLISLIFEQAGYEPVGDVFTNEKYLKQIIAYSREEFRYDEDFVNQRSASARVVVSQSIPTPGAGVNVVFGETLVQDETGYWDGVDQYIISDPDPAASGKILFAVDVMVALNITVAGGTVDISLRDQGGTAATITNVGTGVHTINSKDFSLGDIAFLAEEGGNIRVRISTNSGAPSVTINEGSIVFTPLNYVGTGSGSHTYFNHLMPDMLQKDLIKDFLVCFGLLPFESDGVINCKSIKSLINDKANAKDWTEKRDSEFKDDIVFTDSNYAQTNFFKYSTAEDSFDHGGILIRINKDLGNGSFTIANTLLTLEKTVYSSPFNNTLTEIYGGIMMARIPINGLRTEFENEPGLRKLLVRDQYSFEPAVDYSTPNLNGYLVAYFESPDEELSLNFTQFIDDWYSELSASLQELKIVTRKYNLNELDILSLNDHLLIYDTDSYYLINEVKNFVPENRTDVELFKVV